MNELKVGLLALASIVAIVFMSLKITSNQSGFGEYVPYRTVINDASGIFPKTPIKVAGINAGRIVKMELFGSQALVTFEVLSKIKVTKNSLLRIKSVGFLGDKFLDIYLGDPNAPRLESNALVPGQAGGGLEDLAKDASDIMSDVKAIIKAIKVSIAPEGQETPLKRIVNNIEDLAENTKILTASLRRMTEVNEEKINEMIENLRDLSDSLAYEADRNSQGSLMYDMKKLGPILDDTKKIVEDVKVMVADMKQGKGTVGKLLRDEQIVDQVSQTLSSVNRMMNRINRMEADIAIFSGVNTAYGNHTQFDIDLYPGPERFYRLGFVTNDFGPDSERVREITSDVNGNTTYERRREIETKSFKLNLQIGRKLQRFGFRAGLIETTGGLGVDYFLHDYGMRFATEVFDYRKDLGPNVRGLAEIRLWNVLYTRVAAEDMIKRGDKDTSLTFSAGLRFNDQDLAALVGLMASQ